MNCEKFTHEEIIIALSKAGTISGAAIILGCDRSTVATYQNKHPEIRAAVIEAKEKLLDIAESELMKNVKRGHPSSVFFTLKTLGKNRGYVERVESTGAEGGPIEISKITRTIIDPKKKVKK